MIDFLFNSILLDSRRVEENVTNPKEKQRKISALKREKIPIKRGFSSIRQV